MDGEAGQRVSSEEEEGERWDFVMGGRRGEIRVCGGG